MPGEERYSSAHIRRLSARPTSAYVGVHNMNMNLGLKISGFTLIELMVTIAILAIASAIAIPNFQPIIENAKHRGIISDINSSIGFARSEAIKRGAPIALRAKVAGPSGLRLGWQIFVDNPANPGVFSAATELLLDQAPYDDSVTIGLGTMNGGFELLTFAGAGNIVMSGGGPSTGNRVAVVTGSNAKGTICLAFGGRSRYVDKNVGTTACN